MKRRGVRSRKISQAMFLALFVYSLWSTTYPLSGNLPPAFLFHVDPLVMFTTALSERRLPPGFLWACAMLIGALVGGRIFCGWACPLGTMIDIAGAARQGGHRMIRAERLQRQRGLKFLILAGIVLCAAAGIQAAWIIDPVVLTARFVSLNLIPAVTLALDTVLIHVIRTFRLYGWLYSFYHVLRDTVLGVKVAYFAHAPVVFAGFLAVLGSALLAPRWWCRTVCPLGAGYGLLSRVALLRREVVACVACGHCRPACPTDAIRPDLSYDPAECIVCLECVYACPAQRTRFAFSGWSRRQPRQKKRGADANVSGLSRRSLLVAVAAGMGMTAIGRRQRARGVRENSILIRPPGALQEREFLNHCIRCGNCMKVCPTNGLQPLLFYPSIEALWTPHLVADIGYCEYHCTQCGSVCPTGAIPRLDVARKQKVKLGIARIDRQLCVPYAEKKSCIVCEEHCPVPRKAIVLQREVVDGKVLLKPVVDDKLCIGCGICQTKCPVRPVRAINIAAVGSERIRIGQRDAPRSAPSETEVPAC